MEPLEHYTALVNTPQDEITKSPELEPSYIGPSYTVPGTIDYTYTVPAPVDYSFEVTALPLPQPGHPDPGYLQQLHTGENMVRSETDLLSNVSTIQCPSQLARWW